MSNTNTPPTARHIIERAIHAARHASRTYGNVIGTICDGDDCTHVFRGNDYRFVNADDGTPTRRLCSDCVSLLMIDVGGSS